VVNLAYLDPKRARERLEFTTEYFIMNSRELLAEVADCDDELDSDGTAGDKSDKNGDLDVGILALAAIN